MMESHPIQGISPLYGITLSLGTLLDLLFQVLRQFWNLDITLIIYGLRNGNRLLTLL